MLPKLALKLVRLPAMFGGATIAGVAYLQYQATQAGNYAIDTIKVFGEAAGNTATGFFSGLQEMAEQTQRGWNKTTEDVDLPEWLQKILRLDEESKSKREGSGGGGGKEPQEGRAVAAAAATGAAFGYDQSSEEDSRSDKEILEDDQMMILTRKMIEIRNILQSVGQSGTLTLPSIVVIGSQSSGKSSVLEAIVGHEFLPKGSNMVTRRPIELTLVNTPNAQAEYGEFPALGLGKITDFTSIQRTLTDLNLAVPEKDCVSDDPIQLTIYSPNVPDLSMIDLPGYIQVAGHDQPPELKQKIADLCDKYIQPPNIILAISAADVDLANSTALRSSRRVDPRGERTIGVITKMDLVSPERGHEVLTDKKYPLRLGYVGVVSRIPQTSALFSRGSGNITSAILKNEKAYFSAHPNEFGTHSDTSVGVSTLRKKLMNVLEQTMASSLSGTRDAISQELEEATYEFKVQYNDRPLSAESYLAESLDSFKHSFKAFAESFGRPQVREMLKAELDQRVMDILAQRYWNKPIEDLASKPLEMDPLKDLPKADPDSLYWHRKLDASSSTLTKLGIGRLATTVVANALQSHVDALLSASTFASHPGAHKEITDACNSILNDRFFSTSDQVENCIKPYKFEIEVEDSEWIKGRENVSKVLKEELRACESATKHMEEQIGKRKLKDVMSFIDKVLKGDIVLEGNGAGGAGGFSADLLAKGREGVFLRDRADLIKMRLLAVRSKQCATQKNKYHCPEIFLDVVADKLTSTAVLFLNVELLSEFYYNFPRELDARLGRHLSDEEIERFAREDPRVRRHLDIIRKKELLELALQKIESIRQLDGRSMHRKPDRAHAAKDSRSRWNIF
ncbi:Dynamin superfamily protein, mitochondrial [Penicillium ucsense]|uniref:dynamin GTPase n=1 Tax=Penicillium ucsense TaxID=2839758 RepID=A0A8J8W8L6_9EURO|nr:Dynamin superfamily protein, mitochondrial [Penicillium ucsense]KAF7735451.1 Dynamin superfamily protein, mitochondrial [Penicillium ucsense]